jgi:hypothetical protein
MTHYTWDLSCRENLYVARFAQLFDSWPNINKCDMVRFKSFIHENNLFLIIDVLINITLQILLPWDILGLFLLFVLNKKSCLCFGPLSIPNLEKNILKAVLDSLNRALQVINHASRDYIYKRECKVPTIRTNS